MTKIKKNKTNKKENKFHKANVGKEKKLPTQFHSV